MDNPTEILSFVMGAAALMPLLGACLWFWIGKKFGNEKVAEKIVSVGAVSFMAVSFFCVLYTFLNVEGSARVTFFEWIRFNSKSAVNFAFLLDPLSLTLGLVVTGIGTLIHLYASGYMHGDPGFGRFFTYLNLFVFSMLMLTFSDSLVGVFLGWEGVGLCSYFLISFWFSEEENANAGKKAFIVNRIGDLGFLIAMCALFKVFGTLNIPELLAAVQAGSLTPDQLFWIKIACFGLVLGATGKSAQIPLYVWLPDAMAGPTPVSALIHAATMVTAGVYLTCRMQPLFLLNLEILEILAFIGGLTAIFAASIAIFQNDIKKVLAYSTISQLGFMFLAVGLIAPVAAFFHLITHACFKALLFLGAGSVIHGLHHEQDMRHMGGIRKKMPLTFWTVTIGVFAIAGIPPLSGFVSKDEILHFTWHSHRWWLIMFAFTTAFLTSFYMGRLWVMTFFGKFRGHHEAHESPVSMTAVLIVLAILSAIAGALNWPELWGGSERLNEYLRAVVSQAAGEHTEEAFYSSLKLAGISSLVGIAGLTLAWFRYRNFAGEEFKAPIFRIFKNKYYIDEIYDFAVVQNLKRIGYALWKGVDGFVIDGFLNGCASVSTKASLRFRRLQTGMTQQYALWVWIGFLLLLFGAWSLR
ncbi:MAG: NADH-quinone oxidoreductase subunit L [Deltaproteobacteria bacterium]|nr:NADH-quinone oxidoreductase subunit L [Deltaproteobacteria bacterium]